MRMPAEQEVRVSCSLASSVKMALRTLPITTLPQTELSSGLTLNLSCANHEQPPGVGCLISYSENRKENSHV
jgi:hypothetical protein